MFVVRKVGEGYDKTHIHAPAERMCYVENGYNHGAIRSPAINDHEQGERMTDTSQGEGYWLASDGKWYPPAAPPPPNLPPPPGKKSHTGRTAILIIAGVIVLIIVLAAVLGGGKKHPTSSTATTLASATSTTAVPTTTVPAGPGLNQVAKDGDFAFTVTSVQCGAAAAQAVSETIPAGAQECLVTMTVANDKTSAQTFFASNQYAYDSAGAQFSADDTAVFSLPNSNDFTQVNPGLSITAQVPYQIPASTSIDHFVLHDSAFSGGVTVANR